MKFPFKTVSRLIQSRIPVRTNSKWSDCFSNSSVGKLPLLWVYASVCVCVLAHTGKSAYIFLTSVVCQQSHQQVTSLLSSDRCYTGREAVALLGVITLFIVMRQAYLISLFFLFYILCVLRRPHRLMCIQGIGLHDVHQLQS